MREADQDDRRTLGLLGATGVGVGATIGGGILVLAGVAFAATGPSAILAFALNGGIAMLTALSFAELASRFPQSGGTYTYARRILTIEAAFAVGWIVWFAAVVAAVLYALGFAIFVVPFIEQVIRATGGSPPDWISGRIAMLSYAIGAVGFYTWSLLRSEAGGAQWATIGTMIVFAVLIGGGFWVLFTELPTLDELGQRFSPFLEQGGTGLIQAMGYTFIALQGFDVIAAVGGKVKDPERNIPRAMFLSLGVALLIYIPLLFLIVSVGTPGESVAVVAADDPEILVASAARNFLGPAGYWLVVVAGVLAMLSAMQGNMMAAAALARTMASDHTLPRQFAVVSKDRSTPTAAIKLTAVTIGFVLIAVPDVAAAGAVSSLIFLTTFTLAHGIAYLARKRAAHPSPFQAAAFPLVPLLGGGSCLALGLYQAAAVPSAGVLAALWLSLGAILYVTYLAPRARVVDASMEGRDPHVIRLRGRSPVVLVPIANPAKAGTLVRMAEALAPRAVSRIQLLSVVQMPRDWTEDAAPPQLVDAQRILGGALSAAMSLELRPEALITVHDEPWSEITRVARLSRCEMVVLGIGDVGMSRMAGPLERLVSRVDADVVILGAPSDWDPDRVRKILIPSRGGREQGPIRARLLGSLSRSRPREVTFLGVIPQQVPSAEVRRTERALQALAHDEAPNTGIVVVVQRDDVLAEIVERTANCDLMILGLTRNHRGRVFGSRLLEIAEAAVCPVLMISQRR